jgi:DNA-binding transcriptional LysR family regulator
MELRHLRYFLAVGEASNFTKAAAQRRVAQPALSRQIRDLEDEIGAELLRRSQRGVTLTAEGRLFLQKVRELLNRTVSRWKKSAHRFVADIASCALATGFPQWRYCRQRWQRFKKPCQA